ncbi:DUF5107 domain-containing protein [Microbacterium excoecariae]|uniref:DUF5107 domain-containing protein n=1 Tax=Microbacterium excoecariae TaxID=2715210 RepID=UPI00140907F7
MSTTTPPPSAIHLPAAPADQAAILSAGGVACWSEPVEIDTYEPGEPDPYPLFLDRRVYQGSSGRVYPLPMIDSVAHEKRPRAWEAIHLENAYVRLMLLPEIGGRIHIGYDKVAGYDFLYRNNVIKPALVGLAGPWISGGIEFNWPQHHRPGTFLPVQTRIEREPGGSVVVWHSDLDPLQRLHGTHGVRLEPGSSAVEVEAILHNRTSQPQTFLWWANVAARSHENYQSFFPDDVAFVADHARRAITAFPRADRPYYGVDYPALAAERPGADRIDIYRNIPVPTSYMITDTDGGFFGGYDHDRDAGFVHVADPAISPGKKQWTWGDGEIGRAWDAQLTDTDGPYVELMAGVYTDNQPDFAWLLPGETKRFTQAWMPLHGTGPAREATRDLAIAVAAEGGGTGIRILAARRFEGAAIEALRAGEVIASWRADLSPERAFAGAVDGGEEALEVRVSHGGRVLARWAERRAEPAEPWVATAPPDPGEIAGGDELVVTATHLEQYRHPSRSPERYLEEALARDPGDQRAATALAWRRLARGEDDAARALVDAALARQTRRNLNPRDGEASYLSGVIAERQGDALRADRAYAKAAWNAAWAGPASLARARIALRGGRADDASRLAEAAGAIPEAARILLLARGAGPEEVAEAHRADPLDPALAAWAGAPWPDARTPLDVGADFARAGAVSVALAVTDEAAAAVPSAGQAGPIRLYLRALWRERAGDAAGAAAERRAARAADGALAFPAGLDQHDALVAALAADPDDAVAGALYGMWLLDAGRIRDAARALERACARAADPIAWRNLAVARGLSGESASADAAFARALAARPDARLVFERDVLAAAEGADPALRLARLEEFSAALGARDDLALRHVELLLAAGRLDEAEEILASRRFRPFEGGEGRAIAAFDRAQCDRAAITADPSAAARLLAGGLVPPASLGEGRHPAARPVERLVRLGDALAAAGDPGAADAWRRAVGPDPLAVFERTAGEHTFWEGIAHLRLGDPDAAAAAWGRLTQRAEDLRRAGDEVSYFETSHPELAPFPSDTAPARAREADALDALAARGRAAR